jgi:hypothetical protein
MVWIAVVVLRARLALVEGLSDAEVEALLREG